jgi:acyl-CoA synthetase (AMP-forming)/AMP-acid ligase II
MTIYKSPFEPVQETYIGSIFEFIFGSTNPNYDSKAVAIIDGSTGQKTTYGQLRDLSLQIASGLTNVGLKRGDTVLIFSPNSALYPALIFGGEAAGLTVSTANSAYNASELSHSLKLADAKVMLVGGDLLEVAKETAKQSGMDEKNIFVVPGVAGKLPSNMGKARSYEELLGSKDFKPVKYTEEQAKKQVARESLFTTT